MSLTFTAVSSEHAAAILAGAPIVVESEQPSPYAPITDAFIAYLEHRLGQDAAVDIINASAMSVTARSVVSADRQVNGPAPEAYAQGIWNTIHARLGYEIVEHLKEEQDANADAA